MPNFLENILKNFFPDTIHSAVEDGDTDKATGLIKNGENVNLLDSLGRAPIHIASLQGDADMLGVLLKYQADPEVKSGNGYTALHLAKNTDTASTLLSSGVLVDGKGYKDYTPLHLAKLKGNVGVVKNLLEYGADLGIQNDNARDVMQTRGLRNSVEIEAILRTAKEFDSATDNLHERPRSELFLNDNNVAGFDKLKRFVHRKIRLYGKGRDAEQEDIKKDFKKLLNNKDLKQDVQSSLNEIFNISLRAGDKKIANSVYNIADGNLSVEIDDIENKRQIDNTFAVLGSLELENAELLSVKEKVAGWHGNNPYDSISRYCKYKAIEGAANKDMDEKGTSSLKSDMFAIVANNQLEGVCEHSYVRKVLNERLPINADSHVCEAKTR